ncbi:MAG: L-rhamnose isomerase [Bacteroidota bacterium]|nr:L-rhamnose isomerase [Bacteroidota bacterium]
MKTNKSIEQFYKLAREQYAELGIDTDDVIKKIEDVVISLHCWQADDVGGFETPGAELGGGGIQVTGNYPGKARNIGELKQDIEKVMALLPGQQRLNLHAIYGDFGDNLVDRNEIETKHFRSWIDWAEKMGVGMDFNCTCFSHHRADDGFTLSSKNESNRRFWIEHVKRCREIGAEMGRQLGTPCVHNLWIPDGSKDVPVDRYNLRKILKESLDEIYSEEYPKENLKDSVESKLFGIGSEAMVVGSYDFYLAYAIRNKLMICLDNGHYHPTEQVGDKISSCLQFLDELMLHVTRGLRWDSDHVATFNDEILLIAQEVIRADALSRVNIGLDFFDASINRIGAYVVGTRAAQMAFMYAMLEPVTKLKEYEEEGKYFERLALLEILKSKPFGAVWDYYCYNSGVPVGTEYINEIEKYEKEILMGRI